MIAFTVIGGYLGAGKTTLLNHFLTQSSGRRFGVLINDFGAINIDAELIASRGETTITLTNGCICCSLADGFLNAVDQLLALETPPEHIVVEASGVAEVNQLAQYGHLPGLFLDGVLVVVDVETLLEKVNDRYVGQTVRRQINSADLVILNKVDLIDPSVLKACFEWLKQAHPKVRVVSSVRCELPLPVLAGQPMHERRSEFLFPEHAHYTSWNHVLNDPVTREQLEFFAEGLDATVIRAKGTSGGPSGSGLQLQVVGRRVQITSMNNVGLGTRLVAIGLAGQIDTRSLDALAAQSFGGAR